MVELPGDTLAPEGRVPNQLGPAIREPDGIIMQGVRKAYWSRLAAAERQRATAPEGEPPADLASGLTFSRPDRRDVRRTIQLWHRAMQAYAPRHPAQEQPSRGGSQPDWLQRASQCGEQWKKKGCPLDLEEPVPRTMIERLAAQIRIPVQLFVPQTLFGWLLAWRVFEPDREAARQGMYCDLASTTDWGKYVRGELEDWHAIAIAEIRAAQQQLSLTAAVRHILMARKSSVMAQHRGRCITGYPELGVPVLRTETPYYPSVNAMICEWYALDMGLPTLADRACVSHDGRAYFSISKMVNDIHDLAIDTYTGDVGNGARLYGDGRHGTDTLVTWLVGLGHLLPAVAAKATNRMLTRDDRTFLAGCAGVSYTLWGHRSDLWATVGPMARHGYGWGALREHECRVCQAAPRCGACFYLDVDDCPHLSRATLTGTDADAEEIVHTALTLTGAVDVIPPDAAARAAARLARLSPTALGWHADRKHVDPGTTVVAALTQGIHALAAECSEGDLNTLTNLARTAWWRVLPAFDRPEELTLDIYMYSTAAHPHITLTFGSHIADIVSQPQGQGGAQVVVTRAH
ncbi:hypothetical protein [Streptomyces sp. AK08-02]|uniref:hypothetical protein n=1 Tax=Streptomyces sp. AK08-02 TaxID=3028654 RepID=UPI0029B7255E|nr:hypothetical protein [Streptomyces sp. AK08-02]MDX3745981.1 hypothetical protein [Streptomyces sp. AK08-02]